MSDSYPYPRCSVCSEDLIPDDGELCGVCARAAEERGRRAGIEERDELRLLLRSVRPLIREEFLGAGAMTERGWEKFLARVDAALAPRDSEASIPSVASHGCPKCSKPQPGDLGMGSIEARQLRCTHGKGSQMTPPDSGETCPNCEGRGQIYDEEGVDCGECGGTGSVPALMPIPLSLAQRILAALVQRREWVLADELCAAVERKT